MSHCLISLNTRFEKKVKKVWRVYSRIQKWVPVTSIRRPLRKLLTSVSAGAKDFGRSEGVRLVSKSDLVGSWITFLLLKLLGPWSLRAKAGRQGRTKLCF